tara:strand:+ start:100 stop:1857 length:1758 start_codon:yes stop_codon:yes gene_type:complete
MHEKIYLAQFSVIIEDQFVYFPYSVGCIWAYIESQGTVNRDQLGDIFYIKKPIEDIVNSLDNPKLFGFSHYIWNENYNDALAKAIKKTYPDCLIVYGGPQVPDNNPDWYAERDFIDVCVHQEGEIVFNDILIGIPVEDMLGVSFYKNGQWHKNAPRPRINQLHEMPSPYTMGLFDHILNQSKYMATMTVETDRGCPYRCTFCDWGSATFSKVRKFDLDRVFAEIEWAGNNKIEMLFFANANFGIYKQRDNEIVDYLISTKEKYGYPKIFDTSWAKNSNKDVLELSKKLKDANMLRKFGISMQSLSSTVLENIKRNNMKINDFEYMIEEAQSYDINIMVELIVGLPGETVDSWIDNYCKLMKYKNINIENYPLSLLNNSEINSKETIEEFGLRYEVVDFGDFASQIVRENAKQIVSTNTLTEQELMKVWQWTWCARLGHTLGITNILAEKCEEYGIDAKTFYNTWFEYISTSNGILNEKFVEWNKLLDDYDFIKYNFDYGYLDDIGYNKRSETILELKEFLQLLNVNDNTYELFDIFYYTPEYNYPKTFGDITVDHTGMGSIKKYSAYIGLNRKNSGWRCKILEKT